MLISYRKQGEEAAAESPPIRHSREGGIHPHHPSFPRRRESTIPRTGNPSPSVIPAKAGIHNSRARGNSSTHTPTPEKNTPSFPRKSNPTIRRRNPPPPSVIPAKAGIHPALRGNSRARGNSFPHTGDGLDPVIPAKDGNPSFPRVIDPYPTIRHSHESGIHPHHPSFPRRRESTYPNTRKNTPSFPRNPRVIRHSRLRGNDGMGGFPRRNDTIPVIREGIPRARGNSSGLDTPTPNDG